MSEIVIVATLLAKPGEEQSVEQALRRLVALSNHEPGCVMYALHRSTEASYKFVMIERWSSREAWEIHLRQPQVRQFPRDRLREIPSDVVLEPLEDEPAAGDAP